jgi:hypothetical protein
MDSILGGGGSSSNTNIPKPPNDVKSYQGFIDAYLKNQPTLQTAEDTTRAGEDPLRIEQQQQLQSQFGPTQYSQMLDAFKQLDPTYYANREQLGSAVGGNLASGGPFAGQYAGQLGQANDLTKNLQGQYNLGTQLDPGQAREIEQATRGAQAARGNASGDSAGIAEAYAKGTAGLQLQQQRLQNLEGGFGQQGQALGAASGYNQQQIGNAGSFLGLPNMGTLTAGVAPVSPDRSFSYINPNAGFQGVNLANQGYANQLGAAGLAQNTGGNPWMSAVGALGSVAGGLLASGAFSDRRLKTDIEKVGKDEKGLNLYTFSYKNPQKFIGHMADEVAAHDPSSVAQDPASGYWKVSQEYAPLALEAA